jgi:hypothetical protein
MKQILLITQPALVDVFHLAICQQCGDGKLPVPFGVITQRDAWVTAHMEGTGHEVFSHTEVRITT